MKLKMVVFINYYNQFAIINRFYILNSLRINIFNLKKKTKKLILFLESILVLFSEPIFLFFIFRIYKKLF